MPVAVMPVAVMPVAVIAVAVIPHATVYQSYLWHPAGLNVRAVVE